MKKFLGKCVAGAIAIGAGFAIALALAAAPTYYQTGTNVLTTLLGTERVAVDNGYAGNAVAPVNMFRNARSYATSASTSGAVAMTVSGANELLTGNVGTLTVDLPPSPTDGFLAGVCNAYGTAYTGTITVATTDLSSIVGSSSLVNLAAGACNQFQYTIGSKVWYQVR